MVTATGGTFHLDRKTGQRLADEHLILEFLQSDAQNCRFSFSKAYDYMYEVQVPLNVLCLPT